MPKRYYLAPVVGTGKSPEDARRLDLPTGLPISGYSAVIMDGKNWGLAIIAAADHSLLAGDPKLVPLPDGALDTPMTSLAKSQRTAIAQRCKSRLGVTIDAEQYSTYRELLRALAHQLDPNFDEQRLDVSE